MANIALDNNIDWNTFWLNQLTGEPKSIVSDLLSVRSSTLDIVGPLLLCLEYPFTGRGEWNSSLRAFHILQAITKVNRLPLSDELNSQLRDGLLAAIVGPNWRNRANKELAKYKEKVDTQNGLMKAFTVIQEVNNHLIMAIISRSLKVPVPFEEQNEHFMSLIERYLSNNSKWDVGKKFRSFISVGRQASVALRQIVSTLTEVTRGADIPEVSKPVDMGGSPSRKVPLVERQTVIAKDPSSLRPTELAGGVRLEWLEERDEWVEIDYPSS